MTRKMGFHQISEFSWNESSVFAAFSLVYPAAVILSRFFRCHQYTFSAHSACTNTFTSTFIICCRRYLCECVANSTKRLPIARCSLCRQNEMDTDVEARLGNAYSNMPCALCVYPSERGREGMRFPWMCESVIQRRFHFKRNGGVECAWF